MNAKGRARLFIRVGSILGATVLPYVIVWLLSANHDTMIRIMACGILFGLMMAAAAVINPDLQSHRPPSVPPPRS